MTAPPATEVSNVATAVRVLADVVLALREDQLDLPTPCRDYDVAALAEHVVASLVRISAAAGVTVPVAGDLGPLLRIACVAQATSDGWRRRGVDGVVDFGGRELAAGDLLGVIALECVVHAWDFARAADADVVVPDQLSEDLLRVAHRTLTPGSRRVAGFDDAVPTRRDAAALDRLLAFTGRRP